MSNPFAYFPDVDEFYIESDDLDPDSVTVSLVARDSSGKKGVVKFRFSGDITYPAGDCSDCTDLTIPVSEDFVTQFAASLGYGINKFEPPLDEGLLN